MNFTGKKIAVLGFGMEGKDVLGFLSEEDADITIFDQKNKEEIDLQGVSGHIKLNLGPDYLKEGLKGFDIIIRSPGVYRNIPEILEAEKNGSHVTSAVDIFLGNCPAKIIGVTGTKGKGTTSTLIYDILKNSGKKVFLAGNIGKPFLELLDTLDSKSFVVMELSSFQLIDLTVSPHIGVVLNITEDHLDWHKNIEEYIDAKKNILSHQKDTDFAVINYDYETTRSFERLGGGKKYYFSKTKKVEGSYVLDGDIFLSVNKETEVVGPVEKLLLKGSHNWENISAASLASYLAGAPIDKISKTIFEFKGLEHRLELVKDVSGINFYNDSFSTGPQPVVAAVNSFTEPVTLILGGRGKGLDYTEMAKEIVSKKNIKTVIVIGEMAQDFHSVLVNSGFSNSLIDMGGTDIGAIVQRAFKETPKGGAVVFSPGATSFDMFNNYKERGIKFKEAVNKLI
jgi:UDP-N-acetylmuramoylalanine--D-glutamate ligase